MKVNLSTRVVFVLAMAWTALLAAGCVSAQDPRPVVFPPLDHDELAAVIDRVAALDPGRLADMSEDQVPPPASDSRVRPWHLLTDIAAEIRLEIDRVSGIKPGADPVSLRSAVLNLEEGAEGLRTLSVGRGRAMAALGLAIDNLGRAVRSGELDEEVSRRFLPRIAAVAREVAVDVREMVIQGGAGDLVRREMDRWLAQSDDLVATGNIPAGFESLLDLAAKESNLFFSLDKFEANIRGAFEGQTVGFAYAIARGGQLQRADGVGLARTATDGTPIEQSDLFRMNIASVSKTVTATALLRLLAMKNLTPDTKILAYLPPDWVKGPGIDTLTFRDLLTHHSGFFHPNEAWDYVSLQGYVAEGINPADKADYEYENTNYALFRVMIPFIWGLDPNDFPDMPLSEVTAGCYVYFVNKYVLEPMGIGGASCAEGDPDLLYYPFPAGNTPGIKQVDWTLWAGSSGWFLSARELVQFMAYRRYDDSILSPGVRTAMDDGFLGWNNPVDWSWGYGNHGIYRNHGGDINLLDTCIMEYPNGVQAAVLINSTDGSYPYQCIVLRDAFDGAWILGLQQP